MKIRLRTSRLIDADTVCEYSGTIEIDMPPHHERTRMMMGNLNAIEQDDLEAVKKDAVGLNRVKIFAEAAAAVSERVFGLVGAVELENTHGDKITTKEELWCHPDCIPLVEGLVGKFMTNFVGNRNAP